MKRNLLEDAAARPIRERDAPLSPRSAPIVFDSVEPLLRAVVDSIPSPAALVGRGSHVLLANAAWRAARRRHDAPERDATTVETVLPLLDTGGGAVRLIVHERRRRVPATAEAEAPLTAREREVAQLIAAGLRNGAIAERLGLSPYTVKRHTERVLRKLGVSNRAGVAGRLGAARSSHTPTADADGRAVSNP